MSENPQTDDAMVAALLREREGLVQQGLDDRVAAVDEQLAAHGHKASAGDKKTPASRSTPPKGRRERGSETT